HRRGPRGHADPARGTGRHPDSRDAERRHGQRARRGARGAAIRAGAGDGVAVTVFTNHRATKGTETTQRWWGQPPAAYCLPPTAYRLPPTPIVSSPYTTAVRILMLASEVAPFAKTGGLA